MSSNFSADGIEELAIIEAVINSFMTEISIYRDQSIDLQSKSVDWFLYDRDLRHERVNGTIFGDVFKTRQVSKTGLFAKIVTGLKQFNVFAKKFHLRYLTGY